MHTRNILLFVTVALFLPALCLAQADKTADKTADMTDKNPSAEELIQALTPAPAQEAAPTGSATHGLTRGLTRGFTVKQAPGVPAAPVPPPKVALRVEFAYDSDELTPEAVAVLEELGKALASKALADYRFRIEGHTDSHGAADYNLDLSRRRAAAVSRHLTARFHIPAARMEVVGRGEEAPLASLAPEDGRNRRVEVVNLGS